MRPDEIRGNATLDDFRLEESHPALRGLNTFFRTELRDQLRALERDRRRAVRDVWLIRALAALIIIGFLVLKFLDWVPDGAWWVFASAVVVAGASLLGKWRLGVVRSEVKQFLPRKICDFLGFAYRAEVDQEDIEPFRALGLLPDFAWHDLEDEITGMFEGVDFRIRDADLSARSGKHTRTVFQGPLIDFQVEKAFAGTIVIARDEGWLGNRFSGPGIPLERIKLPEQTFDGVLEAHGRDFESVFELYGDNRDEARRLLSPQMAKRLMSLSEANVHGKMTVAFQKDRIFIAVNRHRDQFEGGDMYEALNDPRRVQAIVDDIGFALGMVEALQPPYG